MNSVLLKLFLTHIDSTARTWRVRDLFCQKIYAKFPAQPKPVSKPKDTVAV